MKRNSRRFMSHVKVPNINMFVEAYIHGRDGRFEDALKCINKHIVRRPDDIQAYYLKTHILEGLGRWAEAAKCADKIWESEDVTPDMMLLRAVQYEQAGDAESALRCVNEADAAGAERSEVLFYRAKITYMLTVKGQADAIAESVAAIQEACRLKGDDAEYHALAAGIYIARYVTDGQIDACTLEESVTCGKKAVELKHDNYYTYYNLGRAYSLMKQFGLATSYFEKSLKHNPHCAKAHAMIASCILKSGKRTTQSYKKMIRILDKALEIDPNLVFALKNKIHIQYALYDTKGVIASLRKLAKAQPDNPMVWMELGSIYVRMQDWNNADKCIDRACKIDPDAPDYEDMMDESDKWKDYMAEVQKHSARIAPMPHID